MIHFDIAEARELARSHRQAAPYDKLPIALMAACEEIERLSKALVLAAVDFENLRAELEQARAEAARGHEAQATLRIVVADRDAARRECEWLRSQLEGRDVSD